MKKIVHISGIPYEIDSSVELSPEQIQQVQIDIGQQLKNLGCPGCGSRQIVPLATAPSTITQGTSHTFTANVSGGAAPYTYTLYVDGAADPNFTNKSMTNDLINNTATATFARTFNEAVGSHIYAIKTTDSCPTGAVTSPADFASVSIICPALSTTLSSNVTSIIQGQTGLFTFTASGGLGFVSAGSTYVNVDLYRVASGGDIKLTSVQVQTSPATSFNLYYTFTEAVGTYQYYCLATDDCNPPQTAKSNTLSIIVTIACTPTVSFSLV